MYRIRLPVSAQDTLLLKASSYSLKEVVVQAKSIERKANRFVVSVSPLEGKEGTELLSQIRGVWLAEDNISINGVQGNVTMGTGLSSTLNRYIPSGTLNARIGK